MPYPHIPRLASLAHRPGRIPLPGIPTPQAHSYATKRGSSPDYSDEDLASARKWLSTLTPDTIPRSICNVSFSRSSGPGGQNVNKVSSKSTLRLPLSALLPLLPPPLHQTITASRYVAPKTSTLVIQADDSRTQTDNANACFRKLHELIVAAGAGNVPGETSEGQKERVRELREAEEKGRRRMKEIRGAKKADRRGRGRDE